MPHTDTPLVERIRARAYDISQGPDSGTPEENWLRAEAEITGQAETPIPTPTPATVATQTVDLEDDPPILLAAGAGNAFTHS